MHRASRKGALGRGAQISRSVQPPARLGPLQATPLVNLGAAGMSAIPPDGVHALAVTTGTMSSRLEALPSSSTQVPGATVLDTTPFFLQVASLNRSSPTEQVAAASGGC